MNTCETCKHWCIGLGYYTGWLTEIKEVKTVKTRYVCRNDKVPFKIETDKEDAEGFGCIHWEEKEQLEDYDLSWKKLL